MNKIILASALSCAFSFVASSTFASEATDTEAKEVVAEAAVEVADSEARNGKELYEAYCMACHAIKGKAEVAPPIFAVKNHVIQVYPERDEFVERVVKWVKAPDADDPLMRGAIRKFGLMPAMPQIVDEELTAVAEFLYDSDMELPDWYMEHYEEEHGEAPKEPKAAE